MTSTTLSPSDKLAECAALIEASVRSLLTVSRIGYNFEEQQKLEPVEPLEPMHESFDISNLLTLSMDKLRAHFEESARRSKERLEEFRALWESDVDHDPSINTHVVVHRSQGRSGKTGKSAAKKSSSTSGDGGGEGDGPHRNKKKKRSSSKIRNTPPHYPASTTVDTHQVSTTHPPAVPATNRGSPPAVSTLDSCPKPTQVTSVSTPHRDALIALVLLTIVVLLTVVALAMLDFPTLAGSVIATIIGLPLLASKFIRPK